MRLAVLIMCVKVFPFSAQSSLVQHQTGVGVRVPASTNCRIPCYTRFLGFFNVQPFRMFTVDERKADFGKNATSQNGGVTKTSQDSLTIQSSQVFVFSTQLANEAATAVSTGTHNSIISYHLEEPNTKRFIQVNGRCLLTSSVSRAHSLT